MSRTLTDGAISARRVFPIIIAFAATCLTATLASDFAYFRTANTLWADFSDWLVTAGVVLGCLALVVALIEVFALRRRFTMRPAVLFAAGMIIALILAIVDMLVHTRDAFGIMPTSLALSGAIVVVMLATMLLTRERAVVDEKVLSP